MAVGCSKMGSKRRRRTKNRLLKLNPYCKYCNKYLTYETATIDHMIPVSKSGPNKNFNLTLSCVECNQDKANRTSDEYIEHLGLLKIHSFIQESGESLLAFLRQKEENSLNPDGSWKNKFTK